MTVSFNRFPALVSTSDGTVVNRAAVVVIDRVARCAVEKPSESAFEGAGVSVLVEMADVEVVSTGRAAVLEGLDGQRWTVEPGDGCGCTSPLSRWYAAQLKGQPAGT